jgi:hypothetical protein
VKADLVNTVDRIGSVATALCDADELLVRLIVVDQLTLDEALALRSCDVSRSDGTIAFVVARTSGIERVNTNARTAGLACRLSDSNDPSAPLCGRTPNASERFLACRLVDGTIRAAGVQFGGRHQLRLAQLRASILPGRD